MVNFMSHVQAGDSRCAHFASVPHFNENGNKPTTSGGTNTDSSSGIQTGGVETLSVANPLSWVIPNANRSDMNSPASRPARVPHFFRSRVSRKSTFETHPL